MIYDISPALTAGIKVWPGDTPLTREIIGDMNRGDTVTLSTLRASVHLGAHADAPSHYGTDAPSIDQCLLEVYLGACQVVPVRAERGRRVGPDAIRVPIEAPRVLIATGSYPDPTSFTEDFAAVEPELVDWLHERGVMLLGIDTPSVDLFDSVSLPAHRACLACQVAILEGLCLRGVPAGVYELIALPLRLVGFDASPVRAVLRACEK